MRNKIKNVINAFWYSHPRVAIAITLLLINVIVIFIFTGIISLISGAEFFDELAYIFTFTMSSDGIYDFVNSVDDLSCFIVKMILAIIQMIIFSGALIGFTTDVLQSTIDKQMNNIGKINLSNHYVFLNWSSIGPRVIYDLSFLEGNKNVVILTNQPREEVINSIESVFTENRQKIKNVRFFVKEGDPMSAKSLSDISLDKAKYIGILLSDVENDDEQNMSNKDLSAIKTLFTMMNVNKNANIVVEVEENETLEKIEKLVNVINPELGKKVIAFSHNSVVGHILGRSIVNPLYNNVYHELLSYEGVEFYGIETCDIEEALYKYSDCIPVINYDDDDRVDESGNAAADQLYILSDNAQTLGVRDEKRSFVKPLNYRENIKHEAFTVFVVSKDGDSRFVEEELNQLAKTDGLDISYKTYVYSDGISGLVSDIESTKGIKKILLLSSAKNQGGNQDTEVFLAALDLKLKAKFDDETFVYAEVMNPTNTSSLQNLGVVSVVVSNKIISLFMVQLLTHPDSKKFYRDLISTNDGEGNDAIDISIVKAKDLLEFSAEYIEFSCQSELVQSFYMASNKAKMCLGVKKYDAKSVRFLCDGMDQEENFKLYPDDELVLAVY
jgi:hypothetical protein